MDSDTQPIFSKQPILKIIEHRLKEEMPSLIDNPDLCTKAATVWLDHHIEHTGIDELDTWDFAEEVFPGLELCYDKEGAELIVNENAPEYLRPWYEFSYKDKSGQDATAYVVID